MRPADALQEALFRIEQENAFVKQQAGDEYAQAKTAHKQGQRESQLNLLSKFVPFASSLYGQGQKMDLARTGYQIKGMKAQADLTRAKAYADNLINKDSFSDVTRFNQAQGLKFLEDVSNNKLAFSARLRFLEQNNPELFQLD